MVAPLIMARLLGGSAARHQVEIHANIAKGFDPRRSGTGLKYKGKKIERLLKRMSADTFQVAMRATNRTGQWSRTHLLRSLSAFLNIPKGKLRWREYRANPKQKKAFYRLTIYRDEYPVSALRGTRFTESKRNPRVGVLRFKTYGKKQVLRPVLRTRGRFFLLRKRGVSERIIRQITGAWLKSDYLASVDIKAEVPVRWFKEFDRLMELAKQKRRRRR